MIKREGNVIVAVMLMLLIIPAFLAAETAVLPGYMAPAPPVIDGVLDEAIWTSAQKLTGLKTFKPDFGKVPSERTEVLLAHDKDNLYVAFRCHAKDVSQVKSSVTKRDNIFSDDLIGILLDTFSDNQSGYGFVVNPQGIQGDGMMNAEGDLDPSADFVWFSKGRMDAEGYTVECRIPATSIRFPSREKLRMKVMIIRQIVRTSEMAVFPEVPGDSGAFLSHCVPVDFSGLKFKRVVELLPAFTNSSQRALDEGAMAAADTHRDVSLTAKVGLTPGMTLDAAYNPDFSQVEADAGQVDVNLRYNLFYDEKRPFFLEGMEIFRFAGNTEDAPLYSIVHTRNIADPVFGLKLSGKISRRNTVAAIVARDQLPGDDGGPTRADFGILRFRHAMKADAYLGGFLTSRSAGKASNQVAGLDGLLRLSSSSATEFHLLGSFTRPEAGAAMESGHALGVNYSLSNRKTSVVVGVQDISKDFRVDSGFITRDGLTRLAAFAMYKIYPKSSFIQRIEPFYWSYHIHDKYSDLMETVNLFTLRFHLPRSSGLRFDLIAANEVFAGQRFNRSGYGTQFYSQLTRQLYFYVFFRRSNAIFYDEENPFGGKTNTFQMSVDYQPTEKFTSSLSLSYADFFRNSDGGKEYDYLILRSRNTFQINKYLFIRGIGEYNTYHRRMVLDFLASFTYIPGTVVHVGYGAAFDRVRWENREYVNDDRFMERQRGFFFKVSYLWRL